LPDPSARQWSSLCAQILGALLRRGGLRQHAGGGAQLGLGLLGLQLQIDFIEGGQRLSDVDSLADFDQAFCDFAGHAETHVGLDPRLDGAHKAALRRFRLVTHRGHQYRTRRRRFLGDLVVAAGQGDRQQGQRYTS